MNPMRAQADRVGLVVGGVPVEEIEEQLSSSAEEQMDNLLASVAASERKYARLMFERPPRASENPESRHYGA